MSQHMAIGQHPLAKPLAQLMPHNQPWRKWKCTSFPPPPPPPPSPPLRKTWFYIVTLSEYHYSSLTVTPTDIIKVLRNTKRIYALNFKHVICIKEVLHKYMAKIIKRDVPKKFRWQWTWANWPCNLFAVSISIAAYRVAVITTAINTRKFFWHF